MYVHMYVTIIDLQTLKIPSFFFLMCLEMGYTPISIHFQLLSWRVMPSRRPHFFGQPHIGGLGAVGDRWGSEDFAIEKCWKCPIYS